MNAAEPKYRVLIICINPYIRIEFQDYLTSLLGEYISFDTASPDELKKASQIKDYQCLLFSTKRLQSEFPLPVPPKTGQLVCTRAFNHAYLDQIIQIPPSEKVYVVNDTLDSARSIIKELEHFGITQYHFIPWGPESKEPDLSVRYAITIGEPLLVPKHIPNMINVGNRTLDISTINELCFFFHLPSELSNQITHNYISHILQTVKKASMYYSNYVFASQLLHTTMSCLSLSLCVVDQHGAIILANRAFLSEWNISDIQFIGKSLNGYLPETAAKISFRQTGDYQVTTPSGINTCMSVQELPINGHSPVFLVTSQAETLHKASSPASSQSDAFSSAEYGLSHPEGPAPASSMELQRSSFMNIATASKVWQSTLDYARRLSLYDFPILIHGESGTQKKALAKAIHKSSSRRNGPFVSLNQLLALSQSSPRQILETANHGTLLVEDLERLSPQTQDFLVQILESANGSPALAVFDTPYNIRVIATTTADLYELTQKKLFHENLFYLLSGSCIDTIPLKKRREDIPLFLEYYFQMLFQDPNFQAQTILSEQLYSFLLNYDYPGNVQEILNLVRHLYSQYAARPLTMSQLPSYIRSRTIQSYPEQGTLKRQVLTIIYDHPKIGRTTIQQKLSNSGITISDGNLRGILKVLAEEGLILVHRTKGGCEITESGAMVLRNSY